MSPETNSRTHRGPDDAPPEDERSPAWKDRLSPQVLARRQSLLETRRDIHRHPELGYQETRTAGLVARRLREMGLEVREGVGKTGVIGVLRGVRRGPVVMYRADMDALPIQEEGRREYGSQVGGVMHACGHDGHVAIALELAEILAAEKGVLAGTVKFVFQPAEEGGGGAEAMIRDGVLGDPVPEWVFGLHLDNDLPVGRVGICPGPMMAACGDFSITVRGRGGHAAAPHLAADPIVAAAHLVVAMQSIVSRQVDPQESAVVTVGSIHGGSKENIIPEEVVLKGTVRCFREELMREIVRRLEQLARGTSESYGAQCRVRFEEGYPATVNDARAADLVRAALLDLVGDPAIEPFRIMGSEDMSYFLRKAPGCYFLVGSRNDEKGLAAPHHSPLFDFDEDAMLLGLEGACRVVRRALQEEAGRGDPIRTKAVPSASVQTEGIRAEAFRADEAVRVDVGGGDEGSRQRDDRHHERRGRHERHGGGERREGHEKREGRERHERRPERDDRTATPSPSSVHTPRSQPSADTREAGTGPAREDREAPPPAPHFEPPATAGEKPLREIPEPDKPREETSRDWLPAVAPKALAGSGEEVVVTEDWGRQLERPDVPPPTGEEPKQEPPPKPSEAAPATPAPSAGAVSRPWLWGKKKRR